MFFLGDACFINFYTYLQTYSLDSYLNGVLLATCRVYNHWFVETGMDIVLLPLPPTPLSKILTLSVTLGWEKWYWVCDQIFLLTFALFWQRLRLDLGSGWGLTFEGSMLCFLVNPTLIKRLEAQKELHIYFAVVGLLFPWTDILTMILVNVNQIQVRIWVGFIWWSGCLPTKAGLGKIYFWCFHLKLNL